MTVYSKNTGFTTTPPPDRRVLQTPRRAPRVSVPPNYRGHAIVDGEERPLGFGDSTISERAQDTPPHADPPVPRFDGLPRVSQLGETRRRPTPPLLQEGSAAEGEDRIVKPDPQPPTPLPPPPPQATAARLPPQKPTGFPTPPRGVLSLGLEELLLLGLILFLLREGGDCTDRGDLDETVILLGLLLLLG